jgi:hypothetical protein
MLGGASSVDSSIEDSSKNSSVLGDECEHAYGKWYVIQPATSDSEGARVAFCEHCGDKIEDTIPKLGVAEESSGNSSVVSESSMNENDGSTENNNTADASGMESSGGKNYDPIEGSGCSATIGGGVIGGLALTGICLILRKKKED